MLVVSRRNDRIIGSLSGNPFNIFYTDDTYKTLVKISEESEKSKNRVEFDKHMAMAQELVESPFGLEVEKANGYLKYNVEKGTYHLVVNKGTVEEAVLTDPIPDVLSTRIVESYEEGNDFMPILMAWSRFLTRGAAEEDNVLFANYLTKLHVNHAEAYRLEEEEGYTAEAAREACTFNDIAITTHGLLATYKVADRVRKIWKLTKDKDGKQVKELVEALPSTEVIDEVTGEITVTAGKPKYLEELTFTPAIHKNGHKFFSDNVLGYKYKIGEEAVLPEEAPRNFKNSFGGGGLSTAA